MNERKVLLISFLRELMRLHKRLPAQIAADLGISHATVSRWLSGKNIPSIKSCLRLAEYSSMPPSKILSIVGYLPSIDSGRATDWPELREYAMGKYPEELDEDMIIMLEALIKHRRQKRRDESQSASRGS